MCANSTKIDMHDVLPKTIFLLQTQSKQIHANEIPFDATIIQKPINKIQYHRETCFLYPL